MDMLGKENLMTVYTAYRILNEMKNKCGIEAMLEYVENYCKILERQNDALKAVLDMALERVDIKRVYEESKQ